MLQEQQQPKGHAVLVACWALSGSTLVKQSVGYVSARAGANQYGRNTNDVSSCDDTPHQAHDRCKAAACKETGQGAPVLVPLQRSVWTIGAAVFFPKRGPVGL